MYWFLSFSDGIMATQTKYPSVKRFGSRYGRRVKEKFGKIESERLLNSDCPFCKISKAKRIAAGIWFCAKCGVKFVSGAYMVNKK